MSEDWVSVAEAAEKAHRSKRRIYDWISDGLVKTMRPGRKLWVYLPDVLRVEAKQKPGRRPKARQRGDLT